MGLSIESGYINFLRSKLKSRIDFLEKYGMVYPEVFIDEDLKYLNSLRLSEASLEQLNSYSQKVASIEAQVENILISYSGERSVSKLE